MPKMQKIQTMQKVVKIRELAIRNIMALVCLLAVACLAAGQTTAGKNSRPASTASSNGAPSNSASAPSASPSTNDANGVSPQTSANDLTIAGCLLAAKSGYILMQNDTNAQFELQGDQSAFQDYKGKVVELRGRELKPEESSGMKPRFQVTSAKVVADQCPVTSKVPTGAGANATEAKPEQDATPTFSTGNPYQTAPSSSVNPNTQGATGAPSAGTGNPPPPNSNATPPPANTAPGSTPGSTTNPPPQHIPPQAQ